MATIEVHALDKISIYELSDRGYGVDVEVARDTDGVYGVWAGQRGSNNGRCLGNAPSGTVLDAGDIAAAMTEVGEAEGWQTVKINGSTVWSSEAAEAVKDALAEDEGEFEFEE
jgi:hypothetical protein